MRQVFINFGLSNPLVHKKEFYYVKVVGKNIIQAIVVIFVKKR